MKPRSPSLTDSLAVMPPEPATDAAIRRAFADPPPPELVTWEVRSGTAIERFQAHRLEITQGSLVFFTENRIVTILAPSSWSRVSRIPTP